MCNEEATYIARTEYHRRPLTAPQHPSCRFLYFSPPEILIPVRTWLSPRKLGIVRISAESFTAADTFYESSHFPKPNSSALVGIFLCHPNVAQINITSFWCWEMTEIDILRTGHFLWEDRTRGRGIIRSRRLVLFPSYVWLFFSLNGPFFLSVQNYQSNPNIYETNTWPKHAYLKVVILQHLFHLRLQKYKSVFTMYLNLFASMVVMQVDCGY